jgi:hypothetical protein
MSQEPALERQTVVDDAKPSAGHVREVPLHVSWISHVPFWARHTVPLATAEQVPTFPVRLHAPQPPLQAVSQQTLLTQNPVTHWLFAVQLNANDTSYSPAAVVTTGVPPVQPPATSTWLFPNNVAVWALVAGSAVGVAVVNAGAAAQVVPSQTSADERKSEPVDDPPTSSTCLPPFTTAVGSSMAL